MSLTVFGMLSGNWVEIKIQRILSARLRHAVFIGVFCILTTASNRESIGLIQWGKYLAWNKLLALSLQQSAFNS